MIKHLFNPSAAKISERTKVDRHYPYQTKIGDFVLITCRLLKMGIGAQINAGAKIVGGGNLIMGKNTVISYNSVILTGTDRLSKGMSDSSRPEDRIIVEGTTILEDDSYIGSGSVVMPKCILRTGAVLGASSYLPIGIIIPENEFWLGQPAEFRSRRKR